MRLIFLEVKSTISPKWTVLWQKSQLTGKIGVIAKVNHCYFLAWEGVCGPTMRREASEEGGFMWSKIRSTSRFERKANLRGPLSKIPREESMLLLMTSAMLSFLFGLHREIKGLIFTQINSYIILSSLSMLMVITSFLPRQYNLKSKVLLNF